MVRRPCTGLYAAGVHRRRDQSSDAVALRADGIDLYFVYFEAARSYLEQHGKLVAFYSDKAAIFRAVQTSTDFGRGATQYGRALFELNIDIMCANTSQAKGRVERANLTLQTGWVKELCLRGINTRDAAKAFAPLVMADFNARFAKPARRD